MSNLTAKVRLLFLHARKHTCVVQINRPLFNSLHKRFLSTPGQKDDLSQSSLGHQSSQTTKDLLENAANFDEEIPSSPDDVWSSPYPYRNLPTDDKHLKKHEEEQDDVMNKSIIMFPGQGSQRKGMGHSLLKYSDVAEMYKTASEILNYDLLKLCVEGPQEKLNETRYCQPALLVTTLAAVQKLKDTEPQAVDNCIATLGFSVGEFASLVLAGALTFEAAVQLVHIRGEAMQAASDLAPSGMMTLFLGPAARLGLALETAEEWAAKTGVKNPVCSVANYLYPSCKVIAGHNQALDFIEVNHKVLDIKSTKRIAVSGAFHTALMEPALEAWKLALSQVTFCEPSIPVYSNVTGQPHTLNTMVKNLEDHLVSPVKWEQCLHTLYQRPRQTKFPKSYECGPGQSLKNILKRVNMKPWNFTYNIST